MEIFEAKMMTDETLNGVSSISQQKQEETVGGDLGVVVVTTKVVEKTEVSVVKMIQDGKEGQGNEVMKNEKEGHFGNLFDDDDDIDGDGMDVNNEGVLAENEEQRENEEVRVPKGNTVKVLVDRMEPVELLLTLKGYATMDPGTRLAELDLALLKSCLNVFYGKRGVEDETRNGPSGSKGNKSNQRRKQKSVAELLREDERKAKKKKATKDGGSGKRKRKALVVSVTPESDHESGGGVEEEAISARQRKKSKYLSPPYLSPVGRGGSGPALGSFKESKPEPEKVLETATKHLENSLKKSGGKKTRQKRGARAGSDPDPNPEPQVEQNKKTIDPAVNVNNVLHMLLRVALDPTLKKNLPAVIDFISSYRSSIFKDGTDRSGLSVTKQKLASDWKKNGGDASGLAVIKQKLESMLDTVQGCEEAEMRADLKASLEGGIKEVLEKVGKMKGK